MSDKLSDCAECGMPCASGEYHPHAACLMFKGCRDSSMVRAGLAAIREHALAASPAPATPVLDEKAFAAWVRTQDGGVGIYDAYLHGTKAAPAISESEWQPIETAPASGKYLVKGGYLKVPGTNHWHWPKAEVRIQRVNHYFYVEDAVYNHPNGSGVSTLIYEPKHWKQLPFDEAIDAARKGEKS